MVDRYRGGTPWCSRSASGIHSMYGDDLDSIHTVRVCTYCYKLCRFDIDCAWWTATEPYIIEEEPV